MNDENYATPDEPAYSVPETVDYTLLSNLDTPVNTEPGDGPGFESEDELPESDYAPEGEDDDNDSV